MIDESYRDLVLGLYANLYWYMLAAGKLQAQAELLLG